MCNVKITYARSFSCFAISEVAYVTQTFQENFQLMYFKIYLLSKLMYCIQTDQEKPILGAFNEW